MEDKFINVITLGSEAVGKTSIINRIKEGKFDEKIATTIGMKHTIIKRKYEKKNLTICLNFRDTMGQEIYQNIMPLQYIRDCHVVLLVFCNIDTLDDIKRRWYNFYKENANVSDSRFILVGNKSDIFGNERDEIVKQGEKFAEEINAHFITCSAKSADNMDNLERYIVTEAKRFINNEENKNSDGGYQQSKSFHVKKHNKEKDKENSDCKC